METAAFEDTISHLSKDKCQDFPYPERDYLSQRHCILYPIPTHKLDAQDLSRITETHPVDPDTQWMHSKFWLLTVLDCDIRSQNIFLITFNLQLENEISYLISEQ